MQPHLTPSDVARFWAKVDRSGGPEACWPRSGWKGKRGHGLFRFYHDGRRIGSLASRYAYELTYGPIPSGMWVLHNCPGGDNPACCNPAHLYLGTPADNARDAVTRRQFAIGDRHWTRLHPERVLRGERNGIRLHPECVQGERNGRARLTTAQVRQIRERLSHGERQTALAAEYGVSKSTISRIARRAGWTDHDSSIDTLD
jgi:hypothetical protein